MDITSFYHSIELNEFKEDKFYNKFSLDSKFEKNHKLKQFIDPLWLIITLE